MFPSPHESKLYKVRKIALHDRVLYMQDQVTLASFHHRPQAELDFLLEELKEAIKIAKES